MESPTLPFVNRYKAVFYSFLLVLWWIGIWGTADTLIHLYFKGQTMKELAVYFSFISIVLFVIFVHPEFIERM